MNEKEAEELAQRMGDACLAVRVRILSRVITSLYERELRPLGLKANQGTLLVCLARAGMIDQGGIGRVLRMEKSTVSRGLERMRAKGWVEKVGPADHRLRLTRSGRELLAQFNACWVRAQEDTLKMLGVEGAELLKKLTANMVNR